MNSVKSYTIHELASKKTIPDIFDHNTHLIYSSPATLAYNSPGAQGFGVKRAGLSIPGSVMLIVSPGCCGRNTSAITRNEVYRHRYFYYLMNETDIVTGRHLSRIPEAVKEIVDDLDYTPSVVMICITCVDALLGTDMERVAKKCEEYAHVRVRPCYMYALTREGRKPPMVHVRESLYSLLEKRPKNPRAVNILGYFSPLDDQTELYDYLKQMGITVINELSRMKSYEQFLKMAEANFNLILHPEARYAAKKMRENLNIGNIELTRFYNLDLIHSQYQAFAHALNSSIDDQAEYQQAKQAVNEMKVFQNTAIAIGETINADSFELALALTRMGFKVKEIYATVSPSHLKYIKALDRLSPDTLVFCNNEPTMLYYDSSKSDVTLTLGKDAAFYHPGVRHLDFNDDVQPFGYQGLIRLLKEMREVLS